MMTIVLIFFLMVLFFVGANYLIYVLVITKARRKFIDPFFRSKSRIIKGVKFTGFFDHGDFGRKKLVLIPVPEMGRSVIATYIYVFVCTDNGETERYTAKISSIFIFVRKVYLRSSDNQKEEIKLPMVDNFLGV